MMVTFTERLRVVPVGVSRVDALDDRRSLLQRVSGVTRELHHRPDGVRGVRAAKIPILDVGLVTMAFLEG